MFAVSGTAVKSARRVHVFRFVPLSAFHKGVGLSQQSVVATVDVRFGETENRQARFVVAVQGPFPMDAAIGANEPLEVRRSLGVGLRQCADELLAGDGVAPLLEGGEDQPAALESADLLEQ